MGMDLLPRKRDANDLTYNWSGWKFLQEFAAKHGVDTTEFSGLNDGDFISPKTCKAIADAIEANRNEYNEAFACTQHSKEQRHTWDCYGPDPATEHAKAWRESDGMRQW